MNLTELNNEQREAVIETKYPVLIFAGAGSGKTRVLAHKIAHLINEQLFQPQNVLAVTFTNKAAKEMKIRVQSILPQINVRSMNVGTFHSIAARILRHEAKYLGFTSAFSIYDTDDSQKLIKDIMNEHQVNIDGVNPKSIRSFISKMKNKFNKPEDVQASAINNKINRISEIYRIYQEKLISSNAMDFDDLLLYPIDLFVKFPERLQYYQKLFQYVLVDEYQDTNKPQFEFIRLLASEHQNVTVVGDDDQSIYGWRGADVQNILNFENIFSKVKIFKLEQNYRSTQNILQAAHSVVEQNTDRAEKKLWTNNDVGDKISVFEAFDERDEAKYIVSNIQKLRNRIADSFTDYAILYRTNAQSRAFEESFIQQGIPYTIVGGTKFYARKEIKDVLAYLRLLVNEKDEVSFNRIINFPTRGIGGTTLEKIKYRGSQLGGSSWDALDGIESLEIRAQQKKSLFQFKGLLENLKSMLSSHSPFDIAKMLIQELHLENYYSSLNSSEDADRWNNIEELLLGIQTFCDDKPEAVLSDFLENVSLQTDIDNWNDSENSVTLMTLHSAKGLEFPVVFIAGLEEGLFPMWMDDERNMDEERRLFYVGVTRAMKKVFLTHAKFRRRYGGDSAIPMLKSEFIDLIPEDLLLLDSTKRKQWDTSANDYRKRIEEIRSYAKAESASTASKQSTPAGNSDYQTGQIVQHKLWGKGKVIDVEGIGEKAKLTILFAGNVNKKLIAGYANLKVIS